MMLDPLGVFVGVVLGCAVSFGADRIWLWFGKSPRDRTDRKLRKWKQQSERRFN